MSFHAFNHKEQLLGLINELLCSCQCPKLCGTEFSGIQWFVVVHEIIGPRPKNGKEAMQNMVKAYGKGIMCGNKDEVIWYCSSCRPDLYYTDPTDPTNPIISRLREGGIDVKGITEFTWECLEKDRNMSTEEILKLWKAKKTE